MNNQHCKDISLTQALVVIISTMIFSTAEANESPIKAETITPTNTACLFNWAQTFYPNLFSPAVTDVQFAAPYMYRYYPNTNAYLGVSSADNHAYYLPPGFASPMDMGDLSALLTEAGCGVQSYPVIFIHGLASSTDTWMTYRDYLISNSQRIFGGIPTYDQTTKTVNFICPPNVNPPIQCTGNQGDFYTINFSDNQGLPFDVQGGELAVIIQAVLNANPGATKVLLIGHSTGGLAARAYLQGLARLPDLVTTAPYREDVAKLVTIGTPHLGSFWAEACHTHFDFFGIIDDVSICDLLNSDIDKDSVVVKDLQPNSAALTLLNDLITHPLPENVAYVSIIGTGQPTLSSLVDFDAGDGIVSDASQNLTTVIGNLPLQQKSVTINLPFGECANRIKIPVIDDIGQTHTCETSDINVGAEILRNLQ